MRVDLRCYAIVDPEVAGGHELPDLCRMLAAGGVTLVQLRDKLSDTRVMVERGRAIKAALGKVPLVINDRVDVALAIGCEGVHIGWDDMAPADARRLLGPDAIIGLTINSPQRADATDLGLIDYAGIGGVYGASIITALTAQNTQGVAGIADVSQPFIKAQFDAVFSDLAVNAVKIGMLSKPETIETVAAGIGYYEPRHVVLDPVMVATSGD